MTRVSKIICGIAALLVFGLPLLWLLVTSLKLRPEYTQNPLGLPRQFTLANYKMVFAEMAFLRYVLISLVLSCGSVLLTLALAAPAAYALSRIPFRGKGIIRLGLLFGLIIPIHITLFPLLKTMGAIGLYDNLTGLGMVYAAFGLAFSVFMLKNAFDEVPVELEESAKIDGCNQFQRFLYVALPLARPTLAVVAIYNFVMNYNEFAFALTLIVTEEKGTLPLGMQHLAGAYGYNIPALAAAISLAVVPVFIIFIIAQRQLITGLTSGAVKG